MAAPTNKQKNFMRELRVRVGEDTFTNIARAVFGVNLLSGSVDAHLAATREEMSQLIYALVKVDERARRLVTA